MWGALAAPGGIVLVDPPLSAQGGHWSFAIDPFPAARLAESGIVGIGVEPAAAALRRPGAVRGLGQFERIGCLGLSRLCRLDRRSGARRLRPVAAEQAVPPVLPRGQGVTAAVPRAFVTPMSLRERCAARPPLIGPWRPLARGWR